MHPDSSPADSDNATSGAAPSLVAQPSLQPSVRPGPYRGDDYRFEEGLGHLLKQVLESMTRQIDARMAEYGITDAQWRPLLLLSLGKCRNAAELARKTSCDTGAMTRMLDRLEDKALVQRVRCTDDRRVQNLALTSVGEKKAGIVPYVIADVLNAHLSGVSAEELVVLKDLLRRMIAAGQQEAARAADSGESR